jgi:hypothetical protein
VVLKEETCRYTTIVDVGAYVMLILHLQVNSTFELVFGLTFDDSQLTPLSVLLVWLRGRLRFGQLSLLMLFEFAFWEGMVGVGDVT